MFAKALQTRRSSDYETAEAFGERKVFLEGVETDVAGGRAYLTAVDMDTVEVEYVADDGGTTDTSRAERSGIGWRWTTSSTIPKDALRGVASFAAAHPHRMVAGEAASKLERRGEAVASARRAEEALARAKEDVGHAAMLARDAHVALLSLPAPTKDQKGIVRVGDDLSRHGLLSNAWDAALQSVKWRVESRGRRIENWFFRSFDAYAKSDGTTPGERLLDVIARSYPKPTADRPRNWEVDVAEWSRRTTLLRLSLALALRDSTLLSWADAPLASSCVDDLARLVPDVPAAPDTVRACVSWAQVPAGGRIPRAVRSAVDVALRRVHESEAPVAFRCRVPDGPEWLDFRLVDGRPFRPVLAPDSWSPISVAKFADAVRGERAWADDPYAAPDGSPARLPGRTQDRVIAAPVHYAPEARPGDDEAEAIAAAVGRVGELVVVGDVVYRSASYPTLHVVERSQKGSMEQQTVAWAVEGLSMWDCQDTLPRGRPVLGLGSTFAAQARLEMDEKWGPFTFPPSGSDVAFRVAAHVAGDTGRVPTPEDVVVEIEGGVAEDPVRVLTANMEAVREYGGLGNNTFERRVGKDEPHVLAAIIKGAVSKRPRIKHGTEGAVTAYRALAATLAEALEGRFEKADERDEDALATMGY